MASAVISDYLCNVPKLVGTVPAFREYIPLYEYQHRSILDDAKADGIVQFYPLSLVFTNVCEWSESVELLSGGVLHMLHHYQSLGLEVYVERTVFETVSFMLNNKSFTIEQDDTGMAFMSKLWYFMMAYWPGVSQPTVNGALRWVQVTHRDVSPSYVYLAID